MGRRKRAAAASQAQILQPQQPLKRSRRKVTQPHRQIQGCSFLLRPRKKKARQIQGGSSPPAAHLLLRCSAAATQVRPLSWWGAKRHRCSRRDWANLGEGPAGLIAERALADDVVDYIHFRAVCLPWRRCSADLGVLADRRLLHPRPWIMLLGERENLSAAKAPHRSRRQFLNASTGRCIQVDVPELRDHGVLQSTGAEGLLVLVGRSTGAVRLLNPLTRQVAELPSITGLGDCSLAYIGSGLPSTALMNDDGTLFLCFFCDGIRKLAFAKPGDERWVLVVDTELLMPSAMMSFAGRFYGVRNGAVMVMETARGGPPRLVVAAKLARRVWAMQDSVHLVDNGGKLMLVHRMLRCTGCADFFFPFKRTYKVYHVNLDAGKTTPARGLGGRAVFIGHYQALSVSSRVFPSIDADTVYLGLDLGERTGVEQIGAYHLRDGSTEPCNYDGRSGLAHPLSIVDCLAAYVSS